jgi:hypothetical protein
MLPEIRARRLIDPDAGFLVSRPNPAKDIAALLADESAAVASAASGSRLQIRTRSVVPPPYIGASNSPETRCPLSVDAPGIGAGTRDFSRR